MPFSVPQIFSCANDLEHQCWLWLKTISKAHDNHVLILLTGLMIAPFFDWYARWKRKLVILRLALKTREKLCYCTRVPKSQLSDRKTEKVGPIIRANNCERRMLGSDTERINYLLRTTVGIRSLTIADAHYLWSIRFDPHGSTCPTSCGDKIKLLNTRPFHCLFARCLMTISPTDTVHSSTTSLQPHVISMFEARKMLLQSFWP